MVDTLFVQAAQPMGQILDYMKQVLGYGIGIFSFHLKGSDQVQTL